MSSSLKINKISISKFTTKYPIKNKNRYAKSDIKILIRKYKEKQIYDSINEKLSEIQNMRTLNNINTELSDKNMALTTSTEFKTSTNFLRDNKKAQFKNHISRTCYHFNKKAKIKTIQYQENQLDREVMLNDEKYLNQYFSRYKQADSLYSILNQKTKKYIDNLNKYVHRVNGSKKKIALGLSPFPNISMNRELKFQDSTNKCVTLYNKSFGSPAIGERYERHMSELLKIKQIIKNIKENDDKKRKEYIHRMLCNYLAKNGIFDVKFYKSEYLSNFQEFLNINFDVKPQIPYKQFLLNILYGHFDKYNLNPMDSNNSSLVYFEKHTKLNRGYSIESNVSSSIKNSTINISRRPSKNMLENLNDLTGEKTENEIERNKIHLFDYNY